MGAPVGGLEDAACILCISHEFRLYVTYKSVFSYSRRFLRPLYQDVCTCLKCYPFLTSLMVSFYKMPLSILYASVCV